MAKSNNRWQMSDKERIARLEGEYDNMSDRIEAIFSYMKDGAEKREVMLEKLTSLADKQEQTIAYQERCDADRENISYDVKAMGARVGTLGHRMGTLEKFKMRTIVFVTGVTILLLCGGVITPKVVELLKTAMMAI